MTKKPSKEKSKDCSWVGSAIHVESSEKVVTQAELAQLIAIVMEHIRKEPITQFKMICPYCEEIAHCTRASNDHIHYKCSCSRWIQ